MVDPMRIFSDNVEFSRCAAALGLSWAPLGELALTRTALTIGNFDGLHRGHQGLIAQTRALARELHGTSAAITFDPHPARYFHPNTAPRLIDTLEQKLQGLAATGLDQLVVLPFARALAQLSAEDFIQRWLVERLGCAAVLVGRRFVFGHGRAGDVPLLERWADRAGFVVRGIIPSESGGETISSSRVRRLVAAGELAEAELLLGRPFALRGTVVSGAGRGATIGIPTANLAAENELWPAPGVYAAQAELADGSLRGAAVNVGRAPTFYQHGELKVEAHLLEHQGSVLGQRLSLQLISQLRHEQSFASVESLVAQIEQDIGEVRQRLAARQPKTATGS